MLKRRASKFTATVAMVAAMLTAGGAANGRHRTGLTHRHRQRQCAVS